ncbi:MAG: hypothetical protein WKF78_06540 [Candidatus Limnocylindrales bacterium]
MSCRSSSAIIAAAIVAIVVLRPQDLAPDALLLDQFDRTVSDGWGEDPHAGRYAVSGTRADYGVASGAATIVVPEAGFTRSALLSGVNERDVELAFRVSMDTPSTEAGSYIYGIMRHADPEHEYRAKIRLSPDGGVYVAVTALVGAKERELSPETRILDLKYAVGTGLDVRARVDGEPATIRVKVWPEGTTEPVGLDGPLECPGRAAAQAWHHRGPGLCFEDEHRRAGHLHLSKLQCPSAGCSGGIRPERPSDGRHERCRCTLAVMRSPVRPVRTGVVTTRFREFLRRYPRGNALFFTKRVNRPAGSMLAALLFETRISSNMVSLAGFGVHVLAAAALAAAAEPIPGWTWLAVLLLWQLAFSLDCADGQLARARGAANPLAPGSTSSSTWSPT